MPTKTQGYARLARPTGANVADGSAAEAYACNKTGGRLNKAAPGLLTVSYIYATRTSADVLASGTYGYGNNGQIHLTVIQNGGVTLSNYVLNALGQRVQKAVTGIATWIDYDGGLAKVPAKWNA